MTVLIGLYLHSMISGNYGIRITNQVKFLGYYDSTNLRRYLNKLIECRMVRLDKRLYYLTEYGPSAVKNISDRSEQLIYDFSNRYGIEL